MMLHVLMMMLYPRMPIVNNLTEYNPNDVEGSSVVDEDSKCGIEIEI